MYHKSIYNYVYRKDIKTSVIFNTLSGSIITIDNKLKKEFDELIDYEINQNSEFLSSLVNQGILVNNKYDEKELIDASRARRTYGEQSAYLRILTTTACNARCPYCYEKGFKVQTMDEKTADKLIEYILNMPVRDKLYIHWFGGEPLLNVKIIDKVMTNIYNKLISKGIKLFVYFTSNGSLLDKAMIERAKNCWHVNYFQITIDDIGNNYNIIKNYVDKKFNYEKVIENIEILLKKEIQVILRINYYPKEIGKVKKVIDTLSSKFENYCNKKLLIFDPAPIFDSKSATHSYCKTVYNMLEPAKYLIEKGLLSEYDALNLKCKSGQCYACHQGSFVVAPNGNLYKCTVTINDENATVGNIFDGVDRNKSYFKWVNPNLPKKCNKCTFLPLCQGGCRAGQLGYLSVFCKRNLAEIKKIINYKVDKMLETSIKLIPIKECRSEKLYEMYQDIPANELGSSNLFNGLTYSNFKKNIKEYINEEFIINPKINTTTKRYILFVNDNPIGEVGIRTSKNDFWINKGSQIYYKIRSSYRNQGYGNKILELGLKEAKKLSFKQIRINCDNNNIASRKIILKNHGTADIIDYKTSDGISTSYVVDLEK